MKVLIFLWLLTLCEPVRAEWRIITRKPFTLDYGGDGDVQNPDENLTFFTAYMAWWVQDTCAVSGGSNPVTPPRNV